MKKITQEHFLWNKSYESVTSFTTIALQLTFGEILENKLLVFFFFFPPVLSQIIANE